jgi:hypothetical protein
MASWSLTAERNNGFDCTFAIGGISCIAAHHYRRYQIRRHTSQSQTDSTGNLQSRSASHRRCTTSPFCVGRNGDFQERCHSLATFQAAWINGSAGLDWRPSGGLLIQTSTGWRQQRVDWLQRFGWAWRAFS